MDTQKTYLIYKLINSRAPSNMHKGSPDFVIIKPTIYNVLRFAKNYYPFVSWWLFHHCGVFYNKCFFMIGHFENNQLVHRTCVFPGYYKFPFMNKEDLQLGEIWTKEDYRRKGLASHAIKYILNLDHYHNKTFYYVVSANNFESIRLAEKIGFIACYKAHKKRKMGLSFIGKYEIATLDNI